MRLAVAIPALNEEATIGAVVDRIPRALEGISAVDIVVVDDGSTDRTGEIARAAGATVVTHERNLGVGKAYQTALDQALRLGADVVVNIDADGQFAPEDIPKLIAPILSGEAEFVTASRFKDPALVPEMTWSRRWGNRMMSRIISAIVGKKFYDVSCGFRACSREAGLRLNLGGAFTYTQETFLELAAKGIHIKEVPLAIRGIREKGKSRVAGNLFRYGDRAMRIIIRAYKDYWPWQFFSLVAAACLIVAFCLGGFLLYWRFTSGGFSPHIWSGFVAGFFFFLGIISLLMGLFGDMLRRVRLNCEQLLYYHKEQDYSKFRADTDES